MLLAGTSVAALALHAVPALASPCLSVTTDTTFNANTTACANWTGGNLSVTNTGVLSGAGNGVSISGSNPGGTLTNSGSISGTSYGIYNPGGTIGTLTNQSGGSISGRSGIANGGTIAVLTNSGSITGSDTGIFNSRTIGTLTNSGSIGGRSSGIDNSGTITNLDNASGGTITGGVAISNVGTIANLTNSSSISGTSFGIISNGSIAALTNSGSISGATYGISNGGRIGTLTNESGGSISGGTGIYNNGGTITALTNNGTITGSVAAIKNIGILGPITNSGLIAGNIVSTAARTLTIDGGSDPTYGTLTGSSGGIGVADEGTITNTASNVVFGSGDVLLNDAINVGSNSVSITSATIEVVNPVSITGAWQQSGGGLVAQAASASSYGYLAVSGNASVANASIVIQGSGLASGNSFTIVRSGATGSYAGDTASVIGTSGLTATVQSVGNNLVVTLATPSSGSSGSGTSTATASASNTFTATGDSAGGVAAPLGAVLDQINGGSSATAVAFQNAVLVPLALLPSGQQGDAIKQLAPVQNSFQVVDVGVSTVLGAVEQHQQLAMAFNPSTGEAAGSDTLDSTLWAQMLGGGSQRDSNAEAAGYRSSDYGLTAGADHLFTPDLLGGVAVSWLRAWTRGTGTSSGQSSTMDSYQLTFYGTYRMGRAFLDGQLGAGWNHFDQNRSIDFLNETASAGYDGQQYLASALAGYDIGVGGPGNMTVTPLAGLRWLRAHTDSYTESGAGAADLSVNGQTTDAVTQELGFRTSWSFQTGIGTIQPEFKAEWLHDYTNGAIATSGVIGGQTFTTTTPRTAADGARIGVAATLVASDSLSFRAEYDGELRSGYQSHTGLIKALWQF